MQIQKKLLSALTAIGLTSKESEIYLIALQLGPATILEISKQTAINRATIYSIVNLLIKKGLMTVEINGFKKLYAAADPRYLENIFEQKKEQLLQSLPIFEQMYQQDSRQALLRYHEGIDSIKMLYTNLLDEVQSGDDYLVIGNQHSWFSLDPKFFSKFIQKRAKLNLKIRLLFEDSPLARKFKKIEKNFHQEIKILPSNTKLTTNLVILPKKIIIHQLSGLALAIVIENQSVVKMHREFFEIMWKAIKEKVE